LKVRATGSDAIARPATDAAATAPEIKKAASRGRKIPGAKNPLVVNQFRTATNTNTAANATTAHP